MVDFLAQHGSDDFPRGGVDLHHAAYEWGLGLEGRWGRWLRWPYGDFQCGQESCAACGEGRGE